LLKIGYPLNRVGGTAASFEIARSELRLLGSDIFPVALKLTLMSAGATGLGHPRNMRCHAQMERLGKLPAILTKRAVQVFRCCGCKTIKLEESVP